MTTQALYSTHNIENLIAHICTSRKITRRDQQQLMAFGSQMGVSEAHLQLLGRVYDLLHRGCIRVVD